MGILQLPMPIAANTGVIPNIKTMCTTDSLATITTAGYLNSVNLEGYPVSATDELHITYAFNTAMQVGTLGIFTVTISNGVITLVEQKSSHGVTATLPTTVGNIATYSDVNGDITQNPTTALTNGNIQAVGTVTVGSSGTTGSVVTLKATNNANNFDFIITNTSSMTGLGPTNTFLLPTLLNGTANFIVSDGTQQMTNTSLLMLGKNNGVCSANTVTTSGQSGQITTESLTTAQYSSYTFTWNNTYLQSSSVVLFSVSKGTATSVIGLYPTIISTSAGTYQISLTNLENAALNGTAVVNYVIF